MSRFLCCKQTIKFKLVLLNQKYVCEGRSKISSYFTLHLMKVGKLKLFKARKVRKELKTILSEINLN